MDALEALGFTEAEITIYLYLLQHPESTAWAIAKDTGMHRSNVYNVTDRLTSKGVLSSVVKDSTKHFKAAEPKYLLAQFREKEILFEKSLPQLENLIPKNNDQVSVEVYKGINGIKTFFRLLLDEAKACKVFGKLMFEELMPVYVENLVAKMDEKKLREKAVLAKGTKIIPAKYSTFKYVDERFLFPNAIVIFNDKVGIFVWNTPPHVILIESKDVACSYEAHFDLLWKMGS